MIRKETLTTQGVIKEEGRFGRLGTREGT